MDFVPSLELVKAAKGGGYAVPSFCVWNAETMVTVLKACEKLRSPVILMNGPGEFPLLDPVSMAAAAKALAGTRTIPVALHLDHGSSAEMARACLDAGYSSVMVDLSRRSFEENVDGLRQVVLMARPHGASVEGELGKVGRLDEMSTESDGASVFTDPGDVARYVAETDVDLLAVSFGNVHGAYAGEPNLDFALLRNLRDAAGIPLVLHGGSGIPQEDLSAAISLGIGKVNVASDLVNAVRSSLIRQWDERRNLWTPTALAEAVESMAAAVERWILALGSNNRV
jgi:ketose-bisphosphate aldolase